MESPWHVYILFIIILPSYVLKDARHSRLELVPFPRDNLFLQAGIKGGRSKRTSRLLERCVIPVTSTVKPAHQGFHSIEYFRLADFPLPLGIPFKRFILFMFLFSFFFYHLRYFPQRFKVLFLIRDKSHSITGQVR